MRRTARSADNGFGWPYSNCPILSQARLARLNTGGLCYVDRSTFIAYNFLALILAPQLSG